MRGRASERTGGGRCNDGWLAGGLAVHVCGLDQGESRRARPAMIGQRTFRPFWRRGGYITLLGRSLIRSADSVRSRRDEDEHKDDGLGRGSSGGRADGRTATVVARKDGQNGSRCLLMQREELDEWPRQ